MNWKLIFSLSLIGLAMSFLTVFVVPMNDEWMCWLPIFLICSFIIAKKSNGKYFQHGFVLSLANCFWIVVVHILLYKNYIILNPHANDMNTLMPLHPRRMMLITGPVIGIASGLIQGLFAFIWSKILKK